MRINLEMASQNIEKLNISKPQISTSDRSATDKAVSEKFKSIDKVELVLDRRLTERRIYPTF